MSTVSNFFDQLISDKKKSAKKDKKLPYDKSWLKSLHQKAMERKNEKP